MKKFTIIYKGAGNSYPVMKTVEASTTMAALRVFEEWAKSDVARDWRNWNVLYIFPPDSKHGASRGNEVKLTTPKQRWVVDGS